MHQLSFNSVITSWPTLKNEQQEVLIFFFLFKITAFLDILCWSFFVSPADIFRVRAKSCHYWTAFRMRKREDSSSRDHTKKVKRAKSFLIVQQEREDLSKGKWKCRNWLTLWGIQPMMALPKVSCQLCMDVVTKDWKKILGRTWKKRRLKRNHKNSHSFVRQRCNR